MNSCPTIDTQTLDTRRENETNKYERNNYCRSLTQIVMPNVNMKGRDKHVQFSGQFLVRISKADKFLFLITEV